MKKRRIIMRALWGIYDNSDRLLKRRKEQDRWIEKVIKNPNTSDFTTYVFGKDNLKHLEDLGIEDLVLVHDKPAPFDLLKEQYRHKLHAIQYAFESGYDEVMHIDWDCEPLKKIDENFWTLMNSKAEFQACLQLYRRRKCVWREDYSEDLRKVPNGGFFYLRNKNYIYEIIKCWEKLRGPSCEPPMALFVEGLMGGKWEGVEEYYKHYEPLTCDLYRASCYTKEQRKDKDLYFLHYAG